MDSIARSGVFLQLPGQMYIRPLLLRSSTKNSRATVTAARFITSGPEVKSIKEQKLEWEYSQIMRETPKKGMVNQFLEWANPTVFGAAVIVAHNLAVFPLQFLLLNRLHLRSRGDKSSCGDSGAAVFSRRAKKEWTNVHLSRQL
ncbi:hypothetical protein Ndes2526B_g05315 [Nannochloris sp. 'desiccata']